MAMMLRVVVSFQLASAKDGGSSATYVLNVGSDTLVSGPSCFLQVVQHDANPQACCGERRCAKRD